MIEVMGAGGASRLHRFVAAQQSVYDQALAELRRGRKVSHWMWYIFPQIAGLGHSEAARTYAIADRTEAEAFLAHSLLGPRLGESTAAAITWAPHREASAIFGMVDALKFRSSMTLFEQAGAAYCGRALDAFYDGERDPLTLELLHPGVRD